MGSGDPDRGRYTITAELGRGGMGVVHSAFDAVRGEEVALKQLLRDRFKSKTELERATTLFEREYHTLSELAHPNIISVYDYGIDASGPFYTMERLRGQSLRACAPLPWVEAARLIRDVASALAIVHSRRLVHRDVTPLNIYRHDNGEAKLIDFGAMIPTGVAKQVVGTPAFIAPECLQLQPLDGQTDLYALGACLYFVLSGRQAYPASGIDVLPRLWKTAPVPLSALVPDIPEALDALVLSLLSIQPASRPRTAADVYERLTTIADLPRSEHGQVVRAYLSKPALVGRDDALHTLREAAQRTLAGRGHAIVIKGPAGLGRSRLLDAALLEAKLSGLHVARADGSDAQGRLHGVPARLLEGLANDGIAVAPVLARHGLASLLGPPSEEPSREDTGRALDRAVLELCQREPLALAIDDLQTLDEPSLAFIASLAAQARRHPLLILVTIDSDVSARESAALHLIEESGRALRLVPLDPAQNRLLLSSMFGEVPNLDLLTTLLHRRCLGNPRQSMDAVEELIAAELVRYEGGAWVISSDADAIAHLLDEQTEIAHLLERLSGDALEILQVLSLDRDANMSLVDYTALTGHGDRARMHQALSQLIESSWLVVTGDRGSFRRDDQRRLLARELDAGLRHTFHRRLAERCAQKPELPPIYEAYHFIRAGLPERALAPMDAMTTFVDEHASADIVRNPITLETLQAFSELQGVPNSHPGASAHYAAAFVTNAVYQGLPERAEPKIDEALAGMSRFTGVADYRELAELPDPERLTQALTRANERCQQPGIGGLDLIRMIRRQSQLAITAAACATFLAEPRLLRGIPDLTPFVPLSPALAIAVCVLDGLCKLARGQSWAAWDKFREADALLSGPDAATIDPLTLVALRISALGYVTSFEAEHATPSVPEHLTRYAQLMPQNAESFRARYHLARGELAQAAEARKRCELLSVQANSFLETRNVEAWASFAIHAMSEDLLRMRQSGATIVEVARSRPGWRFRAALVRSQIQRCQGRTDRALSELVPLIEELPNEHVDFVACSVAHVDLLVAARRDENARDAGESYLARATANGSPTFRLELALARALAELSDHERAEALFGSALAALDSRKVEGILLGRAYETGARVALRRGDAQTFNERAARCAEHYALGQSPSLAVIYARLMREAARAGLTDAGAYENAKSASDGALRAAVRELALLTSDTDFHARALELLVRASGAAGGYLYTRAPEGLRQVARTQGISTTSEVDLDLEATQYYERECRADEATEDIPDEAVSNLMDAVSTSHSELWPCALAYTHPDGRAVEGVVLFYMPRTGRGAHATGLLEELAMLMTVRASRTAAAQETTTTTLH